MGFYTELAPHILKKNGAKQISMEEALNLDANTEGIIVVVDNGFFAAKGWAFSNLELRNFTMVGDTRPKTFLHLKDREEARHACMMEKDPRDMPGYSHHFPGTQQ